MIPSTIRDRLFPARARPARWARPFALAARPLHLAAVAFLLGGHAYGASAEAVWPWLLVALGNRLGPAGRLGWHRAFGWVVTAWGVVLVARGLRDLGVF